MAKPNHQKRKHSKFPASGADIWMNCAGAVSLQAKAPPKFENEFMREGTEAHQMLEFLIRRFSDLQRAKEQALKIWGKREEIAEKFDIAAMADYGELSAKRIMELRPSKDAKLIIEKRVELSHVSTLSRLFGTLDYAWVESWGDLIVLDYKYGAGVPVAPYDDDAKKENHQLMYYGSGMAKLFDYEFDRLVLGVIQPRVWGADEDPVTLHSTTIKKIREWEREAREKVKEALSPNPTLNPGEHCRWCTAASFCPAASKAQMDKAGIVFDVEKGIEKLPEVEPLTAATIPKILEAADLLEPWIGAVRARAFELVCAGETIEGRKLVNRRGNRVWNPDAENSAKEFFGKNYEKCFSKAMLSPRQIELTMGRRGKVFTESNAQMVSSGVTLVKSSDRRKEVSDEVPFDVDNSD